MAFLDEEWDVRWDDDAPGLHSFFHTSAEDRDRRRWQTHSAR